MILQKFLMEVELMTKKECFLKLQALLTLVKQKVDYVSIGKKEIYIFGAGDTSKFYAKSFDTENINPVAFLDNDPEKQGKPFLGTGGGI